MYKVSNLVIMIALLTVFLVTLASTNTKKIPEIYFIFLLLSFLLVISQLTSNLIVPIFTNVIIYSSDLSELSRSYSFIMPILILILLKSNTEFSDEHFFNALLFAILALSIGNLILCLAPKLTMAMDKLVVLYGEGKVYNEGYARYRAFGIIGQPGKCGIFTVVSTIIALLHLNLFSNKRIVVSIIIACSALSAGLTLSRTALILIMFVILFLVNGFRLKLVLYSVILSIGAYMLILEPEFFTRLSRGFDMDSGNYSTASHRLVSKQWALDFITSDFITTLLGVGDSKEYVSQFSNSYASDLSLRTPDSSQTVWMLRFGFIGMLVAYSPIVYLLLLCISSWSKNITIHNTKYMLIPILLIFLLSFVDPMFHDAKINIVNSVLFLYIFQLLLRDNNEKNISRRA